MQLIVQNLLVDYVQQGSGKTILLLHGWADRKETFINLQSELSKKYKVIALDLPGFGKSQGPQQVWNLDDYAKFVSEFIIKIDQSKNIKAIIGHSNGGAVAIRGTALGLLAPDKLVLLASSGVRNTAQAKKLVIKMIAKVGKVATFWLPRKTRQNLQKKLYGTVGSDMLVTPELKETFKKTVSQDIQADASLIPISTLLIYGDQDTATPINEVGEKLHQRIKNSQLEIIPGADHFVHQAEPTKVARIIQEFLL